MLFKTLTLSVLTIVSCYSLSLAPGTQFTPIKEGKKINITIPLKNENDYCAFKIDPSVIGAHVKNSNFNPNTLQCTVRFSTKDFGNCAYRFSPVNGYAPIFTHKRTMEIFADKGSVKGAHILPLCHTLKGYKKIKNLRHFHTNSGHCTAHIDTMLFGTWKPTDHKTFDNLCRLTFKESNSNQLHTVFFHKESHTDNVISSVNGKLCLSRQGKGEPMINHAAFMGQEFYEGNGCRKAMPQPITRVNSGRAYAPRRDRR